MTFREFERLCLALPEAELRETWGEATFRVRDRIFAIGSFGGAHVSVKASLDDQSGLISMDPKTFEMAAYTGRFGWVRVRLRGLSSELGHRLVENAWRRTAPRRLITQYDETARKPGVSMVRRVSGPKAGSPHPRRPRPSD
jgi:hypothetical protein